MNCRKCGKEACGFIETNNLNHTITFRSYYCIEHIAEVEKLISKES